MGSMEFALEWDKSAGRKIDWYKNSNLFICYVINLTLGNSPILSAILTNPGGVEWVISWGEIHLGLILCSFLKI